MNECQGNVQTNGGMDRWNRFYGYPVRLQTVHLANKRNQNKSFGDRFSWKYNFILYIEVNRRKKWNQGKKILWFVF